MFHDVRAYLILARGGAGGARPQLQPQLGDEPGDDAAAPRHSSILGHETPSTTQIKFCDRTEYTYGRRGGALPAAATAPAWQRAGGGAAAPHRSHRCRRRRLRRRRTACSTHLQVIFVAFVGLVDYVCSNLHRSRGCRRRRLRRPPTASSTPRQVGLVLRQDCRPVTIAGTSMSC